MLFRDRFEKEYKPLFERRMMGTTVWSPLAQGLLTGKYNEGTMPEDSRFKKMTDAGGRASIICDRYFGDKVREGNLEKSRKLAEIAKEMECTQAALALAWVLAAEDTSTALLGFSKLSQIDENLKAIAIAEKWTPELEVRINEALGNAPNMELDWRAWKPELPRRL